MTEKEFFIEKAVEETPIFVRVFKALPVGMLSHTHHPKSKTASELMVQMASEAESFVGFLSTGIVDWSKHAEVEADTEKCASLFESSLKAAAAQAKKMTEEEWLSECKAVMNGQTVMTTTRGKMAWLLLFDLVHHRGQLSTYIRPMGGLVPSIYGPSGDTTGM